MNERETKAVLVKKALHGLGAEYGTHFWAESTRGGYDGIHDMAKVNGYSIIWHEGAYCWGEPDTVEVMLPGGEVDGHVPIKKLRKLVSP